MPCSCRFYTLTGVSPRDAPHRTTLPGPCPGGPDQAGTPTARTKGYNRKIKQIKRVACGFRNQTSYERRIKLNNAASAA